MTRLAAVLLGLGSLLLIGGIVMLHVPAAVISAGVLVGVAGVLNLERS